jgi:hypothetical protein
MTHARAFGAGAAALVGSVLATAPAFAQQASAGPPPAEINVTTTQTVTTQTSTSSTGATTYAEVDAPPPQRPRKPGFVTEASVGALGFAGKFRHVAPTAPWFHALFGYEPTRWLLVFIEGELAYTDTSEAVDETRQRAFPIFGGGGGARGTWHLHEKLALYLQGEADALEADTIRGELANLGYANLQKLKPAFGGRIGVEWYQVDRHLAFAVAGGVRDATGFAPSGIGISDTPLIWDAAATIRYTF